MDDSTLKERITTRWDKGSWHYDSHVAHGIGTPDEKRLWMDAFSAVLPDRRSIVLDVGCGTGAMGLILSEMGHTVTGLDLSEKMMEIAGEKAKANGLSMTFERGDAEETPFENDAFDVVVNRHLLWTLPHPEKALSEWKRVVGPGGMVVVVDGRWDDGRPMTKFRRALGLKLEQLFIPQLRNAVCGYDETVQAALPNMGGVPEDRALKYFVDAGFSNAKIHDLGAIRSNQRKQLKWYQKVSPITSYYMVTGVKAWDGEENASSGI
ncbi:MULTISPECIES: class I SAM-dependent methyltransferase [unclassified Methanoculleus]|jgi:ubiquinone/menaquinone biosynthesis C-methylase UbiE|uniref:class I SAM-dependent methyltransferase n=1 Tax=unclassified Methanoculleus TaxID=2619537 RepID=UPI0025F7BA57|nr:class I SAM-dependent methyltransferase [Methanoculleus sp. UBA377]